MEAQNRKITPQTLIFFVCAIGSVAFFSFGQSHSMSQDISLKIARLIGAVLPVWIVLHMFLFRKETMKIQLSFMSSFFFFSILGGIAGSYFFKL